MHLFWDTEAGLLSNQKETGPQPIGLETTSLAFFIHNLKHNTRDAIKKKKTKTKQHVHGCAINTIRTNDTLLISRTLVQNRRVNLSTLNHAYDPVRTTLKKSSSQLVYIHVNLSHLPPRTSINKQNIHHIRLPISPYRARALNWTASQGESRPARCVSIGCLLHF